MRPSSLTDTSVPRSPLPFALSAEQLQVDFVEMLRVRSEKRRLRHVEALRRQKEEEEDGQESLDGGRSREESDAVFSPTSTPQSPTSPDIQTAGTTQTQVSEVNLFV